MEIFCIMDECCPRNELKSHMKEMNWMHDEVMCMKDQQWNCMMNQKNKF